ncbi:hypothetical protein BV898_11485 [Hypsibius exemplaris]|uniref:Uncharacterized protein n=1 Tax=Hypsibius exemplaris TaxID=2072580 RepID=A0A1W0WGQ2_HYPEX|nr:hypothetical protein BV898_11485 [Hypsibius exemplaris]
MKAIRFGFALYALYLALYASLLRHCAGLQRLIADYNSGIRVLSRSLAQSAILTVKTETRTYQAAGQPSKVELVITVQDNSVLDNVYSQVFPVIQEDIKEFRQVAGGLSTEDIFKAGLKRFRQEFMRTERVTGKNITSTPLPPNVTNAETLSTSTKKVC